MIRKFKIGDRVWVSKSYYEKIRGMQGTIKELCCDRCCVLDFGFKNTLEEPEWHVLENWLAQDNELTDELTPEAWFDIKLQKI